MSGVAQIRTTDDFIEKLEKEYKDIKDFSARLVISGLEPPLRVEVLAISEPRTLRVEYLSPPEIKGQFFLLEEDFLYQFMPAQNLVIKKDLKNSDIPVKSANLTPDYLLKLVRSEELEVNLIENPEGLQFPGGIQNVFEFDISIPWLENEDSSDRLLDPGSTTPVTFESGEGDYVLEVIPREDGYQFARQVIRFDPEDFLPRGLITFFRDEKKEPVTTTVEEVETNVGLDLNEVTKLPRDAEVISD